MKCEHTGREIESPLDWPEGEPARCDGCAFWVRREVGSEWGECRVDGPVAGEGRGTWPVTRASDWCGEHVMVDVELPRKDFAPLLALRDAIASGRPHSELLTMADSFWRKMWLGDAT